MVALLKLIARFEMLIFDNDTVYPGGEDNLIKLAKFAPLACVVVATRWSNFKVMS